MNGRTLAALVVWACLVAGVAAAQGFAGLGRAADDFSQPERGYVFSFHQDHGPHPAFQIEWWYLTANLTDAAGAGPRAAMDAFPVRDGTRGTRRLVQPPAVDGACGCDHAADHFVAERLARGGIGQAGVTATPFEAWIDDWHMKGDTPDPAEPAGDGRRFCLFRDIAGQRPAGVSRRERFFAKIGKRTGELLLLSPFYAVEGTLTLPEVRVR